MCLDVLEAGLAGERDGEPLWLLLLHLQSLSGVQHMPKRIIKMKTAF